MVDIGSLQWVPGQVGEDEFIMPDINYKILAKFLKLVLYERGTWKELVELFGKYRLDLILEQTNKYLVGEKEEILKEIEEDLGPAHAPVIIKLLM